MGLGRLSMVLVWHFFVLMKTHLVAIVQFDGRRRNHAGRLLFWSRVLRSRKRERWSRAQSTREVNFLK